MMETLTIPIALTVLAAVVLLADLVPDAGGRRGLGTLVVAGLVGVFFATWAVPLGSAFSGAWQNDAFAVYVHRVLLAAGALGALGAIDHVDRVFPTRQAEYWILFLAALVGMTLLAGANDLLLVAVAFELMGVPMYVLAAMHKDRPDGVEGATKLYLTGALSAGLTMYGLSFVVGVAGRTGIDGLRFVEPSPMFVLGALLAVAGMAYKLGVVPFHFWVADTYASAPTPLVAFLSVAPKVAAFATFARVLLVGLGERQATWGPILLAVSAVTMGIGNLMAVPQTRVRRLLAYSGVAHVGLLVLVLAVGTADGAGAALFYLATYVGSNMGAFLVAEVVGAGAGEELAAWNGLARRNPGLGLAMLLFLLSLGGIPFVAGFWGKFFLFWAAWQAGQTWLVALGASLAVLSLFYYLKVARSIYVEPPSDPRPLPVGRPTAWAIGLAIAMIVGIGLYPRPFFDAARAAGQVVAPSAVAAR